MLRRSVEITAKSGHGPDNLLGLVDAPHARIMPLFLSRHHLVDGLHDGRLGSVLAFRNDGVRVLLELAHVQLGVFPHAVVVAADPDRGLDRIATPVCTEN